MKFTTKFMVVGLTLSLTPAIAHATNIYAEGRVGYFLAPDIETETYTATESGVTFNNFKADLEYEDDFSFGGEVGVDLNNGFRVGLSYRDVELSFDSAKVTGSATDGTTTIDINEPVSRSDVADLGLTFDSDAEIIMATAYYDFQTDSSVTPFLGLGIGQADVKNLKSDENVVSLSAGTRYDLQDNWYLTASASYIQIDGGEDELGIEYEDFDVYLFDLGVGYNF